MKVVMSSVISGFEIYRDASVRSARALGHEVRRSKDFSASPVTRQQACLTGVRWADVTVVLLGRPTGHHNAPVYQPPTKSTEKLGAVTRCWSSCSRG